MGDTSNMLNGSTYIARSATGLGRSVSNLSSALAKAERAGETLEPPTEESPKDSFLKSASRAIGLSPIDVVDDEPSEHDTEVGMYFVPPGVASLNFRGMPKLQLQFWKTLTSVYYMAGMAMSLEFKKCMLLDARSASPPIWSAASRSSTTRVR
jgi:hypothetical protein